MGPWNRKIGKTGYQKNFRDHFRGGVIAPTAPPPYGSAIAHHPTPLT